ncbi:unnamed protein product [Paramecium sonneborni]|uniref:Uncharacterized protein n=1 Tax=Paramecium sonneborni TaxID=65129 RepID=A0A8S1PD91_9CILI|nr:unnamed protein product [Paramecium sonneborni]
MNNADGSQAICVGQYCGDKLQGEYIVKFRESLYDEFQMIGVQNYNEKAKQHGKWIELSIDFSKYFKNKVEQTKSVLKENFLMDVNAINGIQYIETVQILDGMLLEEDNIILRVKRLAIGLNYTIKLAILIVNGIFYTKTFQENMTKIYILQKIMVHLKICIYIKKYLISYNLIYNDNCALKLNKWVNQKLNFVQQEFYNFKAQQNFFFRFVFKWKKIRRMEDCVQELNNEEEIMTKMDKSIKNGLKYKILQMDNHLQSLQGNINMEEEQENGNLVEQNIQIQVIKLCGNFDEFELKQGIWSELITSSNKKHRLIFIGEYKGGKKIGKWIIKTAIYSNDDQKEPKGGEYDSEGQKIGKWREPIINSKQDCLIYQDGEYKSDKKIGYWKFQQNIKIQHRVDKDKYDTIGKGNYNENGEKIGLWMEFCENFKDDSQIIFEGNYQNGKKFGKWISKYRYCEDQEFQEIGGGNFNEEGVKIGYWKELIQNFSDTNQIILKVNYLEGKIYGQVQIEFRKSQGISFTQMFIKNLIQIVAKVFITCLKKKLEFGLIYMMILETFVKQSQKESIRMEQDKDIGIFTLENFMKKSFLKCGNVENGVKNGKWIEIDSQFCRSRQIIKKVKYVKGKKVGDCQILYRDHKTVEFKIIGTGQYDILGKKVGYWLEPHKNYWEFCKLYCFGTYKNGIKQGVWKVSTRQSFVTNDIIGFGTYDEKGRKNKLWVELEQNNILLSNSDQSSLIIEIGEYQDGKKIGNWQTHSNNQIFCLQYDENELKDGLCEELDQQFFLNKFAYLSNYSHGKKIRSSRELLKTIQTNQQGLDQKL